MFKESFLEEKQNQPRIPEKESRKEESEIVQAGAKKETEDKEKMKLEFKKHEKEMEAKEKEVRPEIEAEFRNALESLHTKIQRIQKPDNKFPPRASLEGLLRTIPVFARMQKGAQEMFLNVLMSKKEFKSPDPQVFVAKGMEVLEFFINMAALKKGGDLWLQERIDKRAMQGGELPADESSDEKPKEGEGGRL